MIEMAGLLERMAEGERVAPEEARSIRERLQRLHDFHAVPVADGGAREPAPQPSLRLSADHKPAALSNPGILLQTTAARRSLSPPSFTGPGVARAIAPCAAREPA